MSNWNQKRGGVQVLVHIEHMYDVRSMSGYAVRNTDLDTLTLAELKTGSSNLS